VLRGLARLTAWPFRTATGLQTLTVHGVATTDSAEALRDMALAGLGIIRVSGFIVARDIAEGRLVVLFAEEHVSEDVPVWAVTAPGRHRLPRVQVFVDFLASHAQIGEGMPCARARGYAPGLDVSVACGTRFKAGRLPITPPYPVGSLPSIMHGECISPRQG